MKKTILIITCLFISMVCVFAQSAAIKMKSGQTVTGKFIDASDTTIILMVDGDAGSQTITLPASRIAQGKLPHHRKLVIKDGKITILAKDEIKEEQRRVMAGNPNYAIGKALKVSGATAIGLGIPCLVAGVATCIAGNVGIVTLSNANSKANCKEASYYLFGMGAALTVVGIPLYVGGKKIMDINVNYTGTGAGLAFNF